MKGVFDGGQKVLGGLPADGFGVSLAAVAEHDAEQMRTSSLAFLGDQRRGLTEVDLGFVTGFAFDASEGLLVFPSEGTDKPLHAVVAVQEVALADEILVDPLGGESLIESLQDELAVRFALTSGASIVVGILAVGVRILVVGPDGHFGRF